MFLIKAFCNIFCTWRLLLFICCLSPLSLRAELTDFPIYNDGFQFPERFSVIHSSEAYDYLPIGKLLPKLSVPSVMESDFMSEFYADLQSRLWINQLAELDGTQHEWDQLDLYGFEMDSPELYGPGGRPIGGITLPVESGTWILVFCAVVYFVCVRVRMSHSRIIN